MNGPQGMVETRLADLQEATLGQLRLRRQYSEQLEPFRNDLMDQVDTPRFNLGSGPPGRVD